MKHTTTEIDVANWHGPDRDRNVASFAEHNGYTYEAALDLISRLRARSARTGEALGDLVAAHRKAVAL